jgi:hypothetical protein
MNTSVQPDLDDVETYLDAAFEHGDNSDGDHEIGDLRTYLRAAFQLMSAEQKRCFARKEDVRDCLAASGIKLTEPSVVSTANDGDAVAVGSWGELQTRDGKRVIGTNQSVPGTCFVKKGRRSADGSLELDAEEDTKLCWDGELTARGRDGQREFLTAAYDIVPESEVIVVEAAR